MHFSIDRTVHTTAFDKPVVDHWFDRTQSAARTAPTVSTASPFSLCWSACSPTSCSTYPDLMLDLEMISDVGQERIFPASVTTLF